MLPKPYYQTELGKLYCGDCIDIMRTLETNSIDAVVTDPPYGLSFMGKRWDHNVPSVEIWRECLRLLKPGGHLLSFGGSRTYHRLACAIEDAGFEIRDQIMWVYGSGFPKSLNIGKAVDKLQGRKRTKGNLKFKGGTQLGVINDDNWKPKDVYEDKGTSEWEGWGTALKPAHEPIVVARKPLEGTVAQNCLKWGVGGLDIDGCRIPCKSYMIRGGGGGKGTGWGKKEEINEQRTGRFPANFIHDGSDEVVELMPNNSARFFYCAKASKKERDRGCGDIEDKQGGSYQFRQDGSLDGKIPSHRNNHPTVKPIALMEYLIKLISKEGHTVLDPFMGSGTTGMACKARGRGFIGIEKESDYCEIAAKRISSEAAQGKLFY